MSSAGPLADRFTHASVGGVELGGAVTFAVTRNWRAGATLSYRRFFYTMNSVPGDALAAGGALDELYGLEGAVAYAFWSPDGLETQGIGDQPAIGISTSGGAAHCSNGRASGEIFKSAR